MQNLITTAKVRDYARMHWFKMIMIGMVIFIILKKDFSFTINLNNPDPTEQEIAPLKEEVHQQKTSKKEAPITEHQVAKATSSSLFDMLPSISFNSTNTESSKTSIEKENLTVSEATTEAYINRFGKVAISERQKYGVPASIIIANALLHSASGTRDMAVAGNNHFGLPCTTNWKGGSGIYNDACYRHYENAWTSFRDHSLYLTTGSTRDFVKMGTKDYKAWANAMEKVSIFEIEGLAKKLIVVIEQYELHKLDA